MTEELLRWCFKPSVLAKVGSRPQQFFLDSFVFNNRLYKINRSRSTVSYRIMALFCHHSAKTQHGRVAVELAICKIAMIVPISVAERWFGDVLMMCYVFDPLLADLKKKHINSQFAYQCQQHCALYTDKSAICHVRH